MKIVFCPYFPLRRGNLTITNDHHMRFEAKVKSVLCKLV